MGIGEVVGAVVGVTVGVAVGAGVAVGRGVGVAGRGEGVACGVGVAVGGGVGRAGETLPCPSLPWFTATENPATCVPLFVVRISGSFVSRP